MRIVSIVPVLALNLVFAVPGAMCAQVPVLEVETHLVNLTFTVRNADGELVKGLDRGDFTVDEDGVPQKVTFFSREADLPLTLGLLVDFSSSQDKFLHQHLKDIQLFLSSILRPQDEVFAVCFGDHLRVVSDLSPDPRSAIDGLERFAKGERHFPELESDETRDGGSAVYDAIYASASERMEQRPRRRKALILFTDGEENSSAHDEVDAIAAAQDADTLIYAIRYTHLEHNRLTADNRHGIAALHHIAGQTGGDDYDALHSDLPQVFTQIGNELRSLYSVGYYSTNKRHDDTFRKVVIQVDRPGLIVRAKSGYYAR